MRLGQQVLLLMLSLGGLSPVEAAPEGEARGTPKKVTTQKLTMTGVGDAGTGSGSTDPARAGSKAISTQKLTMTGLGGSPGSDENQTFSAKKITTSKLTMTGVN